MNKPRLLDLFCGGGGCARGYQLAGFYVVGVDIEPQPAYRGDEFIQTDAVTLLDRLLDGGWVGRSSEHVARGGTQYSLSHFDAIHASPPCQGYSRMRHLPWLKDRVYPLLIDPVRERLRATGLPWVIENVEGAPLQRAAGLLGTYGVLLCGTMFELGVYRHRPFESSVNLLQPEHPRHREVISAGRMLGNRASVPVRKGITVWQEDGGCGGHMGNAARVREAMGIDWDMPASALSQAIPPAYTHWIGTQLLDSIKAAA